MKTLAARIPTFASLRIALLLVALPAGAMAREMPTWLLVNTGNPAAPETILSTDVMEKNGLVRGGWKVSGAGVLQSEAGADTGLVYRMVRLLPKGGVLRMLVTSKDEENALVQAGYVTEGAMGYVALKSGPGLMAVTRFTKEGKYLWLIGSADQNWALKNGWTRERAVFWLWQPGDR